MKFASMINEFCYWENTFPFGTTGSVKGKKTKQIPMALLVVSCGCAMGKKPYHIIYT